MLTGIYILMESAMGNIYPQDVRDAISEHVRIDTPPQTRESIAANMDLLADVDVIFSGWGAPTLTPEFLAAAPNLKAVFYGAGSVRGMVTDAVWERDLVLTNANNANGVSVAEYTLGVILLATKQFFSLQRYAHEHGQHRSDARSGLAGNFQSTVGIISLGMIGQHVARHLQRFDHRVIAYDPFLPAAVAAELGVELVDLDTLCAQADVVSLHTPNLPETRGMIHGGHFRAMKPYATFINTARGAVVNEPEMVAVLQERPDIQAILDVTMPEPPVPDSPLWTLPNVMLTPHTAGSLEHECARHGWQMVHELRRWLAGEPLLFQVTEARFATMA